MPIWYQCCSTHSGFDTALPETNQNEIELRFANEMHCAINAARKNVGVDILSLNGKFLVRVSVQGSVNFWRVESLWPGLRQKS